MFARLSHWRIVTTPEFLSAPSHSLLFQAPTFQEPVFQAPASAPAYSEEPETPKRSRAQREDKHSQEERPNQDSGEDTRKRRSRRKKDAASEAPASEETSESSPSDTSAEETRQSLRESRRARRESKGLRNSEEPAPESTEEATGEEDGLSRRRRRRRLRAESSASDEVTALEGSTRLEAKKQRRKDSRRDGRRRQTITESEFLARRESVDRKMVIRHHNGLDQIAVIEDNLLVEHYVARRTQQSMVGNIYLGRVQNVLPSMEAAFVDIGRGRNAVLYAGEVNWDAVGLEGRPRRIESALKSGDAVLVQVTKDPIGHKGARLTSQITLAGRYLVLIPGGSMMGISRKLPETERLRLKKILKKVVPSGAGVIVRTAAEGASEEQLMDDVARLVKQWEDIEKKQTQTKNAPILLRGEPDLAVRVVRDIFNEDFKELVVEGTETYTTIKDYVEELSPELADRVHQWLGQHSVFAEYRVDEQLAKGMDRKVWLPSGGTLVIDRTEAMTVIDVNTGKFIGAGGTLEETVTKNNLEAAEEIVRQLRLRDIGGIVIIDFVDMVLEQNRDLVLRRLVEALGRDRTRHQVTEITSLGLVQMTRKRVGEGLVEAFSTQCEACEGKGFIVHHDPVEHQVPGEPTPKQRKKKSAQVDELRRLEEDAQSREKAREALSAIHKTAARDDNPEEPASEASSIKAEVEPAQTEPASLASVTAGDEAAVGGQEDAVASAEGVQETEPQRSRRSIRERRERRERSTKTARAAKTDEPVIIELPEAKPAEETPVEEPPAPKRKRRRVVSADVVTPVATQAAASIQLPERIEEESPAPASAKRLEDIVLPEAPVAEAQSSSAPKRKRRRVVSTGVIDA